VNVLIAGLVLGALSIQANAHPSTAIVDSCLRTESATRDVRYTAIDTGAFEVIEDEDAKKTATVLHHGKDTVGTWEGTRPMAFGLVFNGKETSLKRIIRLDKEQAPTAFSPYEAVWGIAEDGKKSYICATFNFDGLGKSGRFQNVRGSYLIERSKRAKVPFYAVGNIAAAKK
jgi:hypothetical protein